jgi:Spy/CpxP family protein refolding chaperone
MRLRTGRTGWSRGRGVIAVGLVISLGGFTVACDNSPTDSLNQNTTADASEADYSIVLGDLTEGLGLTDEQIAAVRNVMEEYRGQERQFGQLWYAAEDLQGILNSEQIDAVQARQEEMRAEMKARRDGMRGQFGDQAGRRDRAGRGGQFGRGGEFGGHGPDMGPGMGRGHDGVGGGGLDLSDEQVAELEEIREVMHEALKGILTDEQITVLDEHRAEAEVRREGMTSRREEMRNRWEDRHQAGQDAMVDALELTADQQAAIEILREGFRGQGRPSPEEAVARREAHHQALLEILDDDQEEIWVLHGSLSQLFARQQARSRAGDGSGGQGRHGWRGSGRR